MKTQDKNKNNESLAPVLIFCYNRVNHLQKMFEALNSLDECCNTDLYIFVDGPKRIPDETKKVRLFVEEYISARSSFRTTTIIKSPSNKGLAKSVIDGVNLVFETYDSVIVLEDDLIVSKDFLNYMNSALAFYRDNAAIDSISGYVYNSKLMPCLKKLESDVFFALRGCSWGWGTWKNRWESIKWNVSEMIPTSLNFAFRKAFSQWGLDLPYLLDSYYLGESQSWAIRWVLNQYLFNRYTVYPAVSRIENIGIDGSGTNYKKTVDAYKTEVLAERTNTVFSDFYISRKIQKQFKKACLNYFWAFVLFTKFVFSKRRKIKKLIKMYHGENS